MTGLALVATGALLASISAAAAWWAGAFLRRLPLERALRERTGEAAAARRLARRLLDAAESARRSPQPLPEGAGRALDALLEAHPGLELAVVQRRPDGSAALAASRGGAWARIAPSSLRFDAGLLRQAVDAGRAEWTLERGRSDEDPLLEALSALGFASVFAHGWTDAEETGALIAAWAGKEAARPGVGEDLSLAAASLRSSAALASGSARLSEARERLTRKTLEVQTLHDVAQAMIARAGRGLSSLEAVAAIVTRSLEADLVAFWILDESTGELSAQAGTLGLEGGGPIPRLDVDEDRSAAVRVFKTRKPFMTGDAQNDPTTAADRAALWKAHSLLMAPLIVEDRVLGVMNVGSRRRDAFGGEALALATVVAEEASILVETAVLNRRLTETAARLQALNRMKDEFVSTVSHEFKTPLTTINGYLSVLMGGEAGAVNDKQMKFLGVAKAAVKRLSGLVSDLLDLSRLETGAPVEPRPLDFAELISASVENHRPLAVESGKTLVWSQPPGLPAVSGDPRWLGLVMDNLISNALKFTRPGGRVVVEAADKGEFLLASVADDGIGIPPEDRQNIFERFYRASNRSEVNAPGTGLGLAIAREVVAKHGGKIWFESEVGRGTTFRFVVPAARREGSAP